MFSQLIGIILGISVLTTNPVLAASMPMAKQEEAHILAQKSYSLLDRYSNTFVNDVFADNILLTIAYMRGIVKTDTPINWDEVRKDFSYTLVLKPGETFAFHDGVLPEYQGKITYTTNAHFDSSEGFKSDGWLFGDGVCHLASFMTAVAREAGLTVVAPTRHDFASIPDVDPKDGTAIYYNPNSTGESALQNLYITNTFTTPITISFEKHGSTLTITIEKSI